MENKPVFFLHIFRVKIQKVLPADTVAVYKCDFGDMNLLSVDSLKPLGPEFRNTPQLAIPANLHGIYDKARIYFQKKLLSKFYSNRLVHSFRRYSTEKQRME